MTNSGSGGSDEKKETPSLSGSQSGAVPESLESIKGTSRELSESTVETAATNDDSAQQARRNLQNANQYVEVKNLEEKQIYKELMSQEFFQDCHWILDERGLNKLKYNIQWFDPVYRSKMPKKEGAQGETVTVSMNVFERWCEGQTGFPIVDACMREFVQTGMLHFRGRLLLAQFLVHLLGVDWTLGQKHLAKHAIDYDMSINDSNWHWVACLAMFAPSWSSRDFSPWRYSNWTLFC